MPDAVTQPSEVGSCQSAGKPGRTEHNAGQGRHIRIVWAELLYEERDDRLHGHGDHAHDEDCGKQSQHGGGDQERARRPQPLPAALVRFERDTGRACEVLLGEERHHHTTGEEHASGYPERYARAAPVVYEPAEQRAASGAREHGCLHHPQRVAHAVAWRAGGNQGCRRRDGTGHGAFEDA